MTQSRQSRPRRRLTAGTVATGALPAPLSPAPAPARLPVEGLRCGILLLTETVASEGVQPVPQLTEALQPEAVTVQAPEAELLAAGTDAAPDEDVPAPAAKALTVAVHWQLPRVVVTAAVALSVTPTTVVRACRHGRHRQRHALVRPLTPQVAATVRRRR